MALRHIWKQVKDTVGLPIGLGASNDLLLPLVNEASELLWNEGDWIGKLQRYKLRISNQCNGAMTITWPQQVETIEAIQYCNRPIPVRNVAFEFIENATGNFDTAYWNNGYNSYNGWRAETILGDRQEVCSSVDITHGGGKKIKAYNVLPTDDGKTILLLGYDDNGVWIRTLQNGAYTDGEILNLNASNPPTTVNFFSQLAGVQFPTTPRDGNVYITQIDTLNADQESWLSTYEFNEEVPVYRRSVLAGFPKQAENQCCQAVIALARMRYMPIVYDQDYLQIGNINALKNMLISLQKRDNGDVQGAALYHQMALDALNAELRQYKGVAPKKAVSMQKRSVISTSYNVL